MSVGLLLYVASILLMSIRLVIALALSAIVLLRIAPSSSVVVIVLVVILRWRQLLSAIVVIVVLRRPTILVGVASSVASVVISRRGVIVGAGAHSRAAIGWQGGTIYCAATARRGCHHDTFLHLVNDFVDVRHEGEQFLPHVDSKCDALLRGK